MILIHRLIDTSDINTDRKYFTAWYFYFSYFTIIYFNYVLNAGLLLYMDCFLTQSGISTSTSVKDRSIDKYWLYFTFWQLWYSLVVLAGGQWRQQLVHGLQLKHPAAAAPLTSPELTAAVSSLLASLVLAQGAPASYCFSVRLSSVMAAVKKFVTFSSFATNFLFPFCRLTSALCSFAHRGI